MKGPFPRVVLSLVGLALLSLPVFAALSGDLQGTVVDQSKAVVQGAKVSVRNLSTGATRVVSTNEFGQFSVPQLELGDYEVRIEKGNFRTHREIAVVRSGEKTRVEVQLQVGASEEIVTVEGGTAPTLDVATAQVSNSLEAKVVAELPSQGRDPVALATLSPGIVPVTKDNPFLGSGSFNSNGSRGRANNITVDNITNSDISTTGSSGTGTFSLDAIKEFKLITNNFDAEFGRNSGAQVQIITKGGTNDYHGTAYWFHQNAAFNARDYFDTKGHATPLIRNQWGFTAGGPVIKNHTFVFGHYEGIKRRGQGATATATVLTPAQAAAITDPTSQALFQAVGAPTSATGKLSSSAPNKQDQDSWSVRVDQVNGPHSFFVRYGQNPSTTLSPGNTFINTNLPNYGAGSVSTARALSVGYTWMVTPAIVNQARFAFGRSNPVFPPFTTLKQPWAPVIEISGYDTMGVSRILPQGRTQNTFQYGDTLAWTRGRHTFKFGGDVFRYQAYSFFDADFRGRLTFPSLAAFQAGQPSQWRQNFGTSQRHNFSLDAFWFAQDDYRITDTLTLNLGFRLESSGGVDEEAGLLSNLNPNNNTPLGGGGTGPLGGIDLGGTSFNRNWNPAPRVGVAWNPNHGKLVIRGGYGIAYDFIYLNPITNLRFSAPFVPSIDQRVFTGSNTLAMLVAGSAQAQSDARAAVGQFLPTQKNFGSLSPVDQNLENPRNQQWSFGIEYEVQKNLVLKMTYVGTYNDHLQVSVPINLLKPGAAPAPATSLADETARLTQFTAAFQAESGNASGTIVNNRIDPRFNAVTQVQSAASSVYHGLQVQIVKRFSSGLSFDASYTWAHSIDNVSDALGVLVNDAATLQDPRNLDANRANSQFDVRHRFIGSYLYEPQFTKRFTGVAGKFLHGWGISGVIESRGGFPATLFAGARSGVTDIGMTGGSTDWVNGDPTQVHPVPITQYVTGTKFGLTQPLLGNFGNSGRNRLRLDGLNNWDCAILKSTKVNPKSETQMLQFRWEFYNILNHANFSGFTNTWTSPNFGAYTSTATNMRQMQASLKYIF